MPCSLGFQATTTCCPAAHVKAAIDSLGAHKGQKFQTWIREHMLEKGGVSTTRQLLDRMKLQEKGVTLWKLDTADWVYTAADMAKVEPWANRDKEAGRHHYPLRLVASEVSTQSLVVFPRDADLFYEDEDRAPPADFVRASMSVPGFFQPLSIPYPDPEDPKSNKQCGAVLEGGSQSKIWQARNQYKGIVPQKAVFTDGGTLSNFPVHLFVEDQPKNGGMPLCPTIGVRFGQDRQNLPAIKGLGAFLNGVVETSKNLLDRQFLFRNAAHADWIAPIDTSTFDWLAFNMPPAEQQRLLLAGMEAAQTFLMSKTKHVPKGVPGRTPWSMDEQGGAAAGTTGAALPADAAAAAGSGLAPDAATTEAAAAVMNGDKLSQWETYKIVNQLLDAASKARSDEFVPVARAVLLQNLKLEQRNKDAKACMDEISKAANELGSGWPVAIFMPGYDVDKLEKILNMRRELQTFWRDVQRAYLPVKGQLQVITDNWWSNNWIGRGQKYRLLMEPLDICNWYYGGNHKPKGRPVCHYIDVTDDSGNDRPIGVSLGEEMAVDNNRRPGRYLMLQRVEMLPEARKAFGIERMESSLGLARELKEKVGSMDWAEYVKTVVTAA